MSNILDSNKLEIEITQEEILKDIELDIEKYSCYADKFDYLLAASSGLVCGIYDALNVEELNLRTAQDKGKETAENFVKKTAKVFGCKNSDDLHDSVKFLEDKFHLATDNNKQNYGGNKFHHFKEFSHHPTIFGWGFSMFTQYTHLVVGADTNGMLHIEKVNKSNEKYIGKNPIEKFYYGTIIWFFHLVSDICGSSDGLQRGAIIGKYTATGIPGPILSLAKEFATFCNLNKIQIGKYNVNELLDKLYTGTLFAKHDDNGKIIPNTNIQFDVRTSLGLSMQIMNQAEPVILNEVIVRLFYMLRRLCVEIKDKEIHSIKEFKEIEWDNIKPYNNATLSRMLTVSTGVFTTVDVTDAFIKGNVLAINYVGVARFGFAISTDIINCTKYKDLNRVKQIYEESNYYVRKDLNDNNLDFSYLNNTTLDMMGLTKEQTEILYNMEYYKTLNDVNLTKDKKIIYDIKRLWLSKWKEIITKEYSTFINDENAILHWYSQDELLDKIKEMNPSELWFKLSVLEVVLFKPYYQLFNKNKENKELKVLDKIKNSFDNKKGDCFVNDTFVKLFIDDEKYISNIRKTYFNNKLVVNDTVKKITKTIGTTSISSGLILATTLFTGPIAVMLVGSNFAGLHGAALTSACLAYLGGGAIAAGGFGMAGGSAVIIGGGASLVGITYAQDTTKTILDLADTSVKQLKKEYIKLLTSIETIIIKEEQGKIFVEESHEKFLKMFVELLREKIHNEESIKTSTDKDEIKKLKMINKNIDKKLEIMKITETKLRKIVEEIIDNT